MASGEYEFPILVTCLLILALQIHNPFQGPRQCEKCQCDSLDAQRGSSKAQPLPASGMPAQQSQPTAYRRPVEAAPAAASATSGLSTDALLRELDSIQLKAREQQDTLAAAGRMPPSSPILEQLRAEESSSKQQPPHAAQVPPQAPLSPLAVPQGGSVNLPPQAGLNAFGGQAAGGGGHFGEAAPMLRRRNDFGRFLETRQPRGLGVVLGVGRGDFALRLLGDWSSTSGLILVDPYIHIWRGYNDPSNLLDRDHQLVFEDLRQRLQPYEGKHMLVRDFSHSFAETFRNGGVGLSSPNFVYIDANHAEQAVSRDLALWWPLLSSSGVLAGSTYTDDKDGNVRVRSAVDRFVAKHQLQLYLTHDDVPPSWFCFKP